MIFFEDENHSLDSMWNSLTDVLIRNFNNYYIEIIKVFAIYRLIYIENDFKVDEDGSIISGTLKNSDIDKLLREADLRLTDIFEDSIPEYLNLFPGHYLGDSNFKYDKLISLDAMLCAEDYKNIPLHPENQYITKTTFSNDPVCNNFILFCCYDLVNELLKQLPLAEKMYLFRAYEENFYSAGVEYIDFPIFWALDKYLSQQKISEEALQLLDTALADTKYINFNVLIRKFNVNFYKRKSKKVREKFRF